ncbi:hypothetical protein R1flu_018641 [Riccia fluitans]|uniref:Fanconi anemia group M protein n=2 Tax=Embryophyta TaxID=3193 RepID=A0ABD1ZGF1_9MARC
MSADAFIDDDDFDWEAAVSEIDRVCSKAEASGSRAGPEIRPSQPQSTQRLKQGTLDSFIAEAKGKQHNVGYKQQQQKVSGFFSKDGWNRGHQINTGKQHQTSSGQFRRENDSEFNGGKQQQERAEVSFRVNGIQSDNTNNGKYQQKRSAGVPLGVSGNQGRIETNGLRFQPRHPTGNLQENPRREVPFDPDAARTWIYPANVPHRIYQFDITKVALFSNTLVSLPTGLGKTLIAATVMYNYFRWFPTGKIIFAAPSRPLVVQQIEACHNMVGIPQDMAIDMTGDMSPLVRAENWQSRRVFFVTPQCLEKDIESGTCSLRQIVCLVLDEAHRATGNYSYCVVVRQLLAAKVEYRLLALTATPGSKQATIQSVVDNLQISCLEYRNEDDPDVSQYTHNRKIELMEVPMNAESNRAKDLLVEVLQPIIYRLCGFRVFYNRDIARLTPYEVIQAREKFRQAPPPGIPESEYTQVELYFGLAITLAHIFKLLFTHGMRPAYEMLQQKLQQGVLRRLQGNEAMRHLQSVMKQTVGHGAPSPKLEKVVEIISSHFNTHDPVKTRVIIFTNFRESVKDIMEILGAKCTSVKAMEFIGQSSGKASKGQSQKTQQAVLQQFRAGGFNTIVATSIAEEGLDIMEVDLVICFDANISPLRMIQRMGRTGRKRDEKEGYLAKQNKNKALRKHMVNGGLFSFNFHPSSHMIPHSFRTEVQLVELAIEEFVPRMKKQKTKPSEPSVGLRNLSKEELELLEKYRISSEEVWKPSLIAFPQYQVIPTRVHKVKHSNRTSVLIDTLRSVQETSAQVAGITQITGAEKTTAHAEVSVASVQEHSIDSHEIVDLSCTPEKNVTVNQDLETHQRNGPLPGTSSHDSDWVEDLHIGKFHSAALNEAVKSSYQQVAPGPTKENVALDSSYQLRKRREVSAEDDDFEQDFFTLDLDTSPPVTSYTVTEDKQQVAGATTGFSRIVEVVDRSKEIDKNDADQSINCNTAALQETEQSPFGELLEEDNFLGVVTAIGTHRCKYSSGVVSTTESGLIILASPPSFPSGRSHRERFATSGSYIKEKSVKPVSHKLAQSLGMNLPGRDIESTVKIKLNPVEGQVELQAITTSKKIPRVESVQSADVNIVLPENKLSKVTACTMSDREQKSGSEVEKGSSRLAVIASQGVVPSSPTSKPIIDRGYALSPFSVKTPSGGKTGTDDVQRGDHTSLESAAKHESTPTTPMPATLGTVFTKKGPERQGKVLTTDRRSKKKTPVSSFLCRANGLSPPKGKLLRFSEDCPNSLGKDASISCRTDPLRAHDSVELHNFPKLGASVLDITTPQGRSQKSPSEVWEISGGKDPVSVQKPRKLKRLRKAGEKTKRLSSTPKLKRLKKVGAERLRPPNKSSRSKLKEGKDQMKQFVRNFFDEEAEVSDDDESSEEFDSGEEEDKADGFIDTAGTQHLNGSVDMMTVYRRSLFTQSPADISAQYAHLLRTSPATCSDGTPGSSEDISVTTVPGSSSGGPGDGSSPVNIDSDGRKPFLHQVSRFVHSNVSTAGAGNTDSSFAPNLIHEEQKKLDLRKRKLSFQPRTASVDVSALTSNKSLRGAVAVKSGSHLAARENEGKVSSDLIEQKDPVEFEDDLFDGVDLDALEAEAAQTCRTRSQKVVNSNQEPHQMQDFVANSVDGNTEHQETRHTKPRLLSRLREDDDFVRFGLNGRHWLQTTWQVERLHVSTELTCTAQLTAFQGPVRR